MPSTNSPAPASTPAEILNDDIAALWSNRRAASPRLDFAARRARMER
jgi:hypothetical protein